MPSSPELVLIPSHIAADTAAQTEQGMRPRADYHALQQRLGADILDYSAPDGSRSGATRIARRAACAAALAALGYVRASDYDIIFSNAENVGTPLAILMRLRAPAGRRSHAGLQ